MKLKHLDRMTGKVNDDISDDIRLSMDILDRVHELLEKHFGGKQRLLAEAMGKSEAEVSKMLNGVQNFTTKTISKLQRAFGERIIAVCTDSEHNEYAAVKTYGEAMVSLSVQSSGKIETKTASYTEVLISKRDLKKAQSIYE